MKIFEIFKEENGMYSARRVFAGVFIWLFAALAFYAIENYKAGFGGFVFLPCSICAAVIVLCLFFTTWSDIKEVVAAAKGK
jgi:hypothetical protein